MVTFYDPTQIPGLHGILIQVTTQQACGVQHALMMSFTYLKLVFWLHCLASAELGYGFSHQDKWRAGHGFCHVPFTVSIHSYTRSKYGGALFA